jgi:Putative adhesin
MTNARTTQKRSRKLQNRLFVLLLVFAALSNFAKDIDRLQAIGSGVHGLASSGLRIGSTVYASGLSPAERSCTEVLGELAKTEEFRWTGQVGTGQSIEIKGLNGSINAEPAASGAVEVVALKKAHRSDVASVAIKVVPHANGVTICAVYPSENPDRPNTCEPGRGIGLANGLRDDRGNSSGNNSVRNNDVSVDFTVRVPSGVELIARTVNGEISASSLSGNVDSHTVNGSINISTTGYARAKTVNGEIKAKMGDANWNDSLEFKTVNGDIDLDLPPNLSTKIEADTFNGDIASEFPLAILGRTSRKHISGTIGSGGRELVLKTLNGSIRLRHIG